jgi:hypothetical protein
MHQDRPNIEVINATTVLKQSEVQKSVKAVRTQLKRDFSPIWGKSAELEVLAKATRPSSKTWWIVLIDDSDQGNAVGYHELTSSGDPIGKVAVVTDTNLRRPWSNTLSHEIMEIIIDPYICLASYSATGKDKGRVYAMEICDPCQDPKYSYEIGGVVVSDFLLPSWFEAGRALPRSRYDFRRHIDQPFEILPGGYVPVINPGPKLEWRQLLGPQTPHSVPPASSRRARRLMGRFAWRRSIPKAVRP